MSLYLVATDEARRQLIDYDVPGRKDQDLRGMLIHLKFVASGLTRTRRRKRMELGLDPEKFTVSNYQEGSRGGNIPQIYQHKADRGE
ncbi:MAG: hypothetical protein IPO77_02330 [Acidobacteria bacterium]|nr:hypothetical protein [Acidobacteriota bacterium]